MFLGKLLYLIFLLTVAIVLVINLFELYQTSFKLFQLGSLFSKGFWYSNKSSTSSLTFLAVTTTSAVFLFSYLVFGKQINLLQIANRLLSNMNKYSTNSRLISSKNSHLQKFAMQNGGEIGGISNDGNTCFMNSVIQSLASSRELLKFIDSYIPQQSGNGPMESNGRAVLPLNFTVALKTLLDNVNGRYGSHGKEFSTKPLLNKMPNGPKQNFFTGYDQEDAQEFYQLVMRILEKEYKKLSSSRVSTPEVEDKETPPKFVDISQMANIVTGTHDLGHLGNVYVPASQVDPNLKDCDHKAMPLELVTPVDGISSERIGCLTCGEVGGIRYSLVSGLSLNLPSTTSYYSSFSLTDLLNNWITPEIIEEVNCNRCGLMQTRDFLVDKLDTVKEINNERLIEQFSNRLECIDDELAKPHITDEVFEKLSIKTMIKTSNKSKQIFLARPPPLLSIHINRSVFDPRTYSIVKNSAHVSLKPKLDLTPYVVEPEDINMDARKPFRKQDEAKYSAQNGENAESAEANGEYTEETSDVESISDSEPSGAASSDGKVDENTNPALMYNLKAVISHYGTHNYGHYICYRKLRGTWWRVSDESVYVVTEQEVLTGQGSFMLFYEYDDGHKETLQDISSEEEPEMEAEDLETFSSGGLHTTSDSDSSNVFEPLNPSDSVLDLSHANNSETDFNMMEERALHL